MTGGGVSDRGGGLCPGGGGLYPGGGGLCPRGRGVSVQGVSLSGGLCPGESLFRGLCPGGFSVLEVSMYASYWNAFLFKFCPRNQSVWSCQMN